MLLIFGAAVLPAITAGHRDITAPPTVHAVIHPQQQQNIEPLAERPLVVRGSVMLLPVRIDERSNRWPRDLAVYFDRGGDVRASLLRIDARPVQIERHWTVDLHGWRIEPVDPDDPRSRDIAVAYIAVEVPADADGYIQIGPPGGPRGSRRRVNPIWFDRVENACDDHNAEIATTPRGSPELATPPPDSPALDDPMQHWRRVLLARHDGRPPPDLDHFTRHEAMVARHFADLWLAGLARVAAVSPGIASKATVILTRLCSDGETTIACWAANPDDLSTLLAIMLNHERSDAWVAEQVLAWCDEYEPIRMWVEADLGESVRVAILNRGLPDRVARFRWQDADDIPIAVELPGGSLRHVTIDRPPRQRAPAPGLPPPPEPSRFELVMESGEDIRRILTVGPREFVAVPPGVTFTALVPPIVLQEADIGLTPSPPPQRLANVTFRRLHGRWEVFFECFRPQNASKSAAAEPARDLSDFARPEDVRGIEAVTLLIGSESATDGAGIALTVPEVGDERIWTSRIATRDLEIHRRSYADRWYCRIVLPDEWVYLAHRPTTPVAVMRSHAGRSSIDIAPGISVPWRTTPGRILIDFTRWPD